jgi:hypothetical protein
MRLDCGWKMLWCYSGFEVALGCRSGQWVECQSVDEDTVGTAQRPCGTARAASQQMSLSQKKGRGQPPSQRRTLARRLLERPESLRETYL